MAGNLTLAIIKPHIVMGRNVGKIIARIEEAGFGIIGAKMLHLRKEGAEEFYKAEENGTGVLFADLIKQICKAPVWVLILAKANAVDEWNNFIGSTNPTTADAGTLRNEFGNHSKLDENAVHGSSTDHDAQREIMFFFGREIKLGERILEIDDKHGF